MSRCVFVFVLLLAVCLFMCSCGVKTIVTSEYVSEYPTTEFEVNSDNMSKVISQNEVSSNSDAGSSSNKPTSSHNPSSNTATSTESEPNESENEFNYANYYTRATDDKAEAIIYKATEGYPTFDNYVVQVNVGSNWYNVPVYNAEVKRVNEPVQNTYFAHFDLSGEATVRIIPRDNFSSFEVNPQHDIQNLQKESRFITFSVTAGDQLSVEFDDDIMGNLQLFVNPIDENIPDENDSNVIFLKPGIYTHENCNFITKTSDRTKPSISLKSNQTLYLCGGAVLKAEVVIGDGVNNAAVRGRGIIDLLDYNTKSGDLNETNEFFGFRVFGVNASKCANITIEGVIIKNSTAYAIMGNGVNKATIDNVKMFSKCTDGLDFVASNHVDIKNCFFRTNDDGIAIYASRWVYKGGASNWNVNNCVFLIDRAHAINIGTHGSQNADNRDEICNLKFSDLDILDVYENSSYYWGAIAFNIGDENYCHDIEFENIRMDQLTKSMPFMISVKKDSNFNPNPGYRLENVRFKNITLNGSVYNKSKIYGYDNLRIVNNVSFENMTVNKTKVTNSTYNKYFEVGNFVNNLTFE